jgi:hypothetical protein
VVETGKRDTAITAVVRYLEAKFPGWTVENFSAMPERQAHRFRVARSGTAYLATVSFDFLKFTPDIPEKLSRWRLAEQMSAAGPEGVLVTEGVTPL